LKCPHSVLAKTNPPGTKTREAAATPKAQTDHADSAGIILMATNI
jgi:hypothetical protein